MKALLAILLLAFTTYGQTSDLGIKTDYDRFRDITTVKLTESLMPDRPGYVLLSVIASWKGKDRQLGPPRDVMFIIESHTDDWYFLKTSNVLRVIQDDKRYELGEMRRFDSAVDRYGVREFLSIELPFTAVEKLSRASKAEIQIGKYEAALSPEAVEHLRAWVNIFTQ